MKASDVYTIAKALPHAEVVKLYDMLKTDVSTKDTFKKKRKVLPKYTLDDALLYLLENHIK